MFLSAVRSKSKPASSATVSNSPLPSLSHPWSLALVTVWPARNGMSGAGVPWSNRTRIERSQSAGLAGGRIRWIETARGEFQHRDDLFARDVEPFHNLVDGRPGFQVLEDSGNRHASILEHPGAAQSARHALHSGA